MKKKPAKPTRTEKRIVTLKKKEEKLKADFLEELKTTPVIQVAAQKIGMGRSTYYKWKNDDPVFAKAVESSLEVGASFINDMAESQLIKKIQEADNTMIIFWLKNHHPAYNEKILHRHEHKIEVERDFTPEEIIETIQACHNMGIYTDNYAKYATKVEEKKISHRQKMIEEDGDEYGT
jgi:flagellar motor switch protein FliG